MKVNLDLFGSTRTFSLSILDSSIGDIALETPSISYNSTINEPFKRFMREESLTLIPVVKEDFVIGQLHRNRFLENIVLGKFGYGIHLNSRKSVSEVMEKPSFMLDYSITLEQAAHMIQSRQIKNLYDDIIVTKKERYYGLVPINILLEAITQKSIVLAKDANPLTGMPGNWAIQREVEKRIKDQISFDVSYIDINNFKPYNDVYGFNMGDKAIIYLGIAILETITGVKNAFAGHIGGDDFIIITNPQDSFKIAENAIQIFESYLPDLHGEDFLKGYYTSKNRKGEEEVFELLTIACAIVSNENLTIKSYGQLASISADAKSEAKKRSKFYKKSYIFKERRKVF
ncbi:MAG: diguanylate cyclase [Thermodesulfovibrionales bacterium]|nr:diguanylate cyclase [Thermodesulfovibrionales bacterium]